MPPTAQQTLHNLSTQSIPLQGKTDDEDLSEMTIAGTKVPNDILRETVKMMKAKGDTPEEILEKILLFDELAEKGELEAYLRENRPA